MTTEPERRYDAFAPALYRYCWSLVGPQAADAALRRALLAAPRLAGELSDPDDLQPWLFALARTACRRHGFAAVSPYAGLAASAEERPVAQMLAGLPPSSREMLELHLRHGLTASQIAKVCGLDRETCGELCRAAERRAAELLPEPAAALALLEPPGPPPGLFSGPLGSRAEAGEAAEEMRPLGPDGFPLHRRRGADRPTEPTGEAGEAGEAKEAGAAEEPFAQQPRPLPEDRVTTADVGVPLRPEPVRDGHRAWSWAAVSGLVTVALALMLSAAVLLSGPGTVAGAGPPPIGTGAPATAQATAPADRGDAPGEAPSSRPGSEPSAAPSPGTGGDGDPAPGSSGAPGEAPADRPSAPPAAPEDPEQPAPEPSRTADPAPPDPEPSGTAPPPTEEPPRSGPVSRFLDGIAELFSP